MHPFDDDVLVLRPNRLVLAAASAPVVIGGVLAIVGLSAQLPAFVGSGLAIAWIGAATLLYAWDRDVCRVERTARARVDGQGLFLDGALALGASRIRAAWVQPEAHRGLPSVRFRTRPWGRLEVVLRDKPAARAMLRALDEDRPPAPVRFWTSPRPLAEPYAHARVACLLGMFIVLGLVVGQAVPLALVLAVAALMALCAGVSVPTRLTVGADGVLMEWLGTERFLAWADVAAVEPFDGGAVLVLSKDRWVTLKMPDVRDARDPAAGAMIERMQAAWRADRNATAWRDEVAARLLRREGSRTREWVRAMRNLAGGEELGYRSPAVLPERLWRVVEDPGAEPTARIGAAIALSASLDEESRERMLAASDACAEPRVRIALATTATGSGCSPDEDLASALDAIDSAVSTGR